MPLLCKQRALYVKGCVIPNGIMDSQGDTLYSEDIKKIFTSFNNQDNFEIYHEDNPIPEVSLLENYISTADETLGTAVVPSGSWNVVIRVDNPEIQQGLLTGELGGLSLSNRIAPRCKGNLKGTIRYQDVPDAECVVPRFISFVKGGANGYGLHVYDYDAYILKSKDVEFKKDENGGLKMDFKEFLNGLKSLIKEAETPTEEPAIEKEDEETTEEEVAETTEEVVEVIEEAEAAESEEEPVVEKEDESATEEEEVEVEADSEAEEEEAEEPTVEKADETEAPEDEAEETAEAEPTLEERVANLEKLVAELTKKPEEETDEDVEETPDPETEPEDEDTPKITKSEKVIIETETVQQKNYYQMSGRDPLTGKKIRK